MPGRLGGMSTTLPRLGVYSLDAYDLETMEDEPVTDIDEAWCDEIAKRIGDIDSGRVRLIPVEEGNARIRARLAAKHAQQ